MKTASNSAASSAHSLYLISLLFLFFFSKGCSVSFCFFVFSSTNTTKKFLEERNVEPFFSSIASTYHWSETVSFPVNNLSLKQPRQHCHCALLVKCFIDPLIYHLLTENSGISLLSPQYHIANSSCFYNNWTLSAFYLKGQTGVSCRGKYDKTVDCICAKDKKRGHNASPRYCVFVRWLITVKNKDIPCGRSCTMHFCVLHLLMYTINLF